MRQCYLRSFSNVVRLCLVNVYLAALRNAKRVFIVVATSQPGSSFSGFLVQTWLPNQGPMLLASAPCRLFENT
jgi:hypothetical protein